MMILSKARAAFPGDQVRIMMGRHVDASGYDYPAGTEFTPRFSGTDNLHDPAHTVQIVTVAGKKVTFRKPMQLLAPARVGPT